MGLFLVLFFSGEQEPYCIAETDIITTIITADETTNSLNCLWIRAEIIAILNVKPDTVREIFMSLVTEQY